MTSKRGDEPAARANSAGEQGASPSTFEQTDASPRAISLAAVGLLLTLALASAVVAATRHLFSPRGPNYRSAEVAQKHRFERRAPLKQAPPGVHIYPDVELQKIRRAESEKLTRYRWVDSTGRVARIPIARAMEIIVAESSGTEPSGGAP